MTQVREFTQYDLSPAFGPTMLQDVNGLIDLSLASAIKFVALGSKLGLITGAATPLQGAFTANTTLDSDVLTSVSAPGFTNIWALPQFSSPITGPGIPPPALLAGAWVPTSAASFNQPAGTITMSANATATATGVTLTLNRSVVIYQWNAGDTNVADIYSTVWTLTTAAGPQTVPSAVALRESFLIDVDLDAT